MSNINEIRYEYTSPLAWINDLEKPGTKANDRLLRLLADIESDTDNPPLGYKSAAAMWAAKDKVYARINAFKSRYKPDSRYPAWYDPNAKTQDNAEPILAAAYSILIAMAAYLAAVKNTPSTVRNVPRYSPLPKTPATSSPAAPAPAAPAVTESPTRFDIDKSGFNWWILAALAAAWYFYKKGK